MVKSKRYLASAKNEDKGSCLVWREMFITKAIQSCIHPDQASSCKSWVRHLRRLGIISGDMYTKLSWLSDAKRHVLEHPEVLMAKDVGDLF